MFTYGVKTKKAEKLKTEISDQFSTQPNPTRGSTQLTDNSGTHNTIYSLYSYYILRFSYKIRWQHSKR